MQKSKQLSNIIEEFNKNKYDHFGLYTTYMDMNSDKNFNQLWELLVNFHSGKYYA